MGIIKKIIDGSNGHKLKRTVLVIEEQVQNQNFIRRALRKKYQISMTANREVAYAIANQEKPDLIVLSRNGKKTIDLCAKLKSEERTQNIPILIIAEDGSNIVEYYFKRVEGYLIKPFSESRLLYHVEELIKSDKVFDTKY